MRLIGMVMLLAVTRFGLAQDSGDFKPATSNVLDAKYPRVDSSSRVEIRVKAPDATRVRVNFWSGPKADMEKQADGYWTLTTPALAPGLHYYTVIVDGAEESIIAGAALVRGHRDARAQRTVAVRARASFAVVARKPFVDWLRLAAAGELADAGRA